MEYKAVLSLDCAVVFFLIHLLRLGPASLLKAGVHAFCKGPLAKSLTCITYVLSKSCLIAVKGPS